MSRAAGAEFVSLFGQSIDKIPGVYQQGLMVFGLGGGLIYERFLDDDVIIAIQNFCDDHSIPALAYAGEEIYCRSRSALTDKVTELFDPLPIEFPLGIHKLSAQGTRVHKVIMLAEEDSTLTQLRPELERSLADRVTITKAVQGMLEVLPPGANKGDGVRRLLEHIGVSPAKVIAFGDGENDIEMLELVGVGVAMENASPKLKSRAAFLTSSNDDDGVARVLQLLPAFTHECKQ